MHFALLPEVESYILVDGKIAIAVEITKSKGTVSRSLSHEITTINCGWIFLISITGNSGKQKQKSRCNKDDKELFRKVWKIGKEN